MAEPDPILLKTLNAALKTGQGDKTLTEVVEKLEKKENFSPNDLEALQTLIKQIEETQKQDITGLLDEIKQEQDKDLANSTGDLEKLFIEGRKNYEKGDLEFYELIMIVQSLKKFDPENTVANEFLENTIYIKEEFNKQVDNFTNSAENNSEQPDQLANIVITAKQIIDLELEDEGLKKEANKWVDTDTLFDFYAELKNNNEIENAFIVLNIAEEISGKDLKKEWAPFDKLYEEFEQAFKNPERAQYTYALAEFMQAVYPDQSAIKPALLKAINHNIESLSRKDNLKPRDLSSKANLYQEAVTITEYKNPDLVRNLLESKIACHLQSNFAIKTGLLFSNSQESVQNAEKIAKEILSKIDKLPETQEEVKIFLNRAVAQLEQNKNNINLETNNVNKTINKIQNIDIQGWKEAKIQDSFAFHKLTKELQYKNFGDYSSDQIEANESESLKNYYASVLTIYLAEEFKIESWGITKKLTGGIDYSAPSKENANKLAKAIIDQWDYDDLPKDKEGVKSFISNIVISIDNIKDKINLWKIDDTLKHVNDVNAMAYLKPDLKNAELQNKLDNLFNTTAKKEEPLLVDVIKVDSKQKNEVRFRQKLGAIIYGASGGIAAGGYFGGLFGAVATGGALGLAAGLAFDQAVDADKNLSVQSGIGKILDRGGMAGLAAAKSLTHELSQAKNHIKMGVVAATANRIGLPTSLQLGLTLLTILPSAIINAAKDYRKQADEIDKAQNEGIAQKIAEQQVIEAKQDIKNNASKIFSLKRIGFAVLVGAVASGLGVLAVGYLVGGGVVSSAIATISSYICGAIGATVGYLKYDGLANKLGDLNKSLLNKNNTPASAKLEPREKDNIVSVEKTQKQEVEKKPSLVNKLLNNFKKGPNNKSPSK
jgi:hypothetical protein